MKWLPKEKNRLDLNGTSSYPGQDLKAILTPFFPAALKSSAKFSQLPQFSSVAQLCPTLCNPVDCNIPGLPVHSQLPESPQTHVHRVGDAVQPYYPLLSPSPPTFKSFPVSGPFPVSQFFASGGQNIRVSASASVLPMNNQDWFPLRWTGWSSLQSKGLSRVFSNTTLQNHQFFSPQLSL